MKERNLKLDNAKGILITLVVIGHMLLPIQGTTRGVTNFFYMIYTFHMPAFVFISGLLAQRIYTRVPKGRFNLRRWCSTLWLYLLFQFILFFSEIPAYGRTTRFPDFLHTSGAPWYLLALLLWYLMIPFFAGYRGKVLPLRPVCSNRRLQLSERRAQSDEHPQTGRRSLPDEGLQAGRQLQPSESRAQRGTPCSLIAWILLTSLSLAGGYLASGALAGIGDFLALDRVIAFAPFFFAGYFIGPERLMEFLGGKQESVAAPKRATSRRRSPKGTSKRVDRGIVLVLTALGLLCFVLIGTQTFERLLPYRNVVYGAWYYRFHPEQNPAAFPGALATQLWLIRLAWFLVSGLMSFALLALMPNRQIPLLTTTGQRTLQIYILHRPIRDLLLASGFIIAAGPENSAHVLLLIALSILMTIVLSAGILQRLFDAIQKLPERLLL
ncbi:MAG: acyltransferase family protein [Lachnospiraceae bacterium]|nr:acyltransferase family protein [Lachnospiraceae bacterium]